MDISTLQRQKISYFDTITIIQVSMNFTDRLISVILIASLGMGYFRGQAKTETDLWRIEISMPDAEYKSMKKKSAVEFNFNPQTFSINGQQVASKEMHTRGKTTLKFWRKSYTVELRDSFTFAGPNSTKEMDHFYLISMSLDRYYYHNELAFRCLAKVGLFPLWYHLTELKINGQSEGLYLIVQRPADFVLKDLGSSAIIRRSSTEFIAKEKYSKQTSEDIRKICRDHFHDIRKSGKRWEGEILYDSLQSYLVLDHYFSWLNFNYLVQNGDYTDELFYYLMPSVTPVRFDIIPWDFDDILVKNPHEGAEVRKSRLSDQLLFSSEDALDLIIARDPYLYKKYLENFDFVLDHLNPGAMENIFNEIKDDLRPYLEKEEIVLASQHDYHPVENWKEASAHMGRILNFLKKRWSETRTEVKKQLRRS